MSVSGLGSGRSNEWFTPACVFEALGCRFDLDVAAPKGGPLHVPCDRWISADSLSCKWDGFVWMNPPFGGRNGIWPWLNKFLDHDYGIALTPDRTSAPWFQQSAGRADAILLTRKTSFIRPDGSSTGNPAFGNALWACGERGVSALRRAHLRGFGMLWIPSAVAA